MLVTLVESIGGLQELESQLTQLGPSTPMLQPPWLRQWWQFFGQAEEAGVSPQLLLLAVYNGDGALVGLAPFHVDCEREVRFLGSGMVCSDHLSILCQVENETEVTRSIVDWLLDEDRGRPYWQAMELEGIDRDDTAIQSFVTSLRGRSDVLITSRPDTGSWYVDLPDTWEAFLGQLSKGRRKRCRRWERNFFDTQRAVLRSFTTADQLQEGFDILEQLHNRRRRDLGEPGVFEDSTFSGFHRSVANDLAATNSVRLTCLELDGQLIAAEYLLLGENTIYAYQSGIEPTALEFNPGHLSVMANIRYAIESGFKTFDFMRGDESYKTNWGGSPRAAIRLRVWQRNVSGRLRQLVETARQNSKPVVSKLKSLVD